MKYIITVASLFLIFACKKEIDQKIASTTEEFPIILKSQGITVDGLNTDSTWSTVEWNPIDQRWLGEPFQANDFEGRYKLSWDDSLLYVLAEIKDDTLIDIHQDALDHYWDDDCLEIFLDEDASKGNHQYNHNAFAYHIALDGNIVDICPDSIPAYYNHHVKSKRVTNGNLSTWEVAIRIYDENYVDSLKANNPRIPLQKDKKIGFAIAYCDNDKSKSRENFVGSTVVKGEDKDQGWIDAGIFQTMILKE